MALAAPDAGYDVAYQVDDSAKGLLAELSALKLKALKKRAREEGVREDLLEDADDADDTRSAVIQLILDTTSDRTGQEHEARQALESELAGMKLTALKKRARSSGVSADKLDDADDADNIKNAVIELIVSAELNSESLHVSDDNPHGQQQGLHEERKGLKPMAPHARATESCADSAAEDDAMESEEARAALQSLRLMALHRLAVSEGVDVLTTLKAAMESDDPKAAVIELLLALPE